MPNYYYSRAGLLWSYVKYKPAAGKKKSLKSMAARLKKGEPGINLFRLNKIIDSIFDGV